MIDGLHTPFFTFDDAAKAIDRPVATVRNWAARGGFDLDRRFDRNSPSGGVRLLSLASIFRLAIAVELVGYGVPRTYAFKAASVFTDVGTHGGSLDHEEPMQLVGRQPGQLFCEGETLLIVWKPHTSGKDGGQNVSLPSQIAEVVKINPNDKYQPTFTKFFLQQRAGRTLQDSFVVVNCTHICRAVAARLDADVEYDDGRAG